jgi:hypothetical protein
MQGMRHSENAMVFLREASFGKGGVDFGISSVEVDLGSHAPAPRRGMGSGGRVCKGLCLAGVTYRLPFSLKLALG